MTLSLIYTGEVGNGGHSQFFLNRGGRIAREVVQALDAASLGRAKHILLRACGVFPGGVVPDEPENILDDLPDSARSVLDGLDRELSAERVDGALLAYLQRNADLVLLPERGLAEQGEGP